MTLEEIFIDLLNQNARAVLLRIQSHRCEERLARSIPNPGIALKSKWLPEMGGISPLRIEVQLPHGGKIFIDKARKGVVEVELLRLPIGRSPSSSYKDVIIEIPHVVDRGTRSAPST